MEVLEARRIEKETPFPGAGHEALYEYWQSKCRLGTLPGRQDIDPAEMPPRLLPNILLVGVEPSIRGNYTFHFRLIGTNIVRYAGRDMTGHTFEQLYTNPTHFAEKQEAYAQVVDSGEPHCGDTSLRISGREYVSFSRMLLPLASNGVEVDMILGLCVFESPRHC